LWIDQIEHSGDSRPYQVRPHFRLYVTPIQIDPVAPAMPISTPSGYAAEVARATGLYYTQGLPDDTKALIKSIKRVRVLLGEVELVNPVDNNGNDVEVEAHPFIWEIDNREGFKNLGSPFTLMAKQKRLPVQHWIECSSEERSMATGAKYYVPNAQLLLSETIDLSEEDQQTFTNFMEWINNYNDYIIKTWNEKMTQRMEADEHEDIANQFIDVEGE